MKGARRYARLSVLLLLITACSASTMAYPHLSSDGLYLKVPKSWKTTNTVDLTAYEGKNPDQSAQDRAANVRWQEAYSPNYVSPAKVFSISAGNDPVVFVRVRDLYAEERDAVSLNSLRNAVVPTVSWAKEPAKYAYSSIIDEEKSFQGGWGVHLRFSFQSSESAEDPHQIMDQTALLSPDSSTLYILVVRCSQACFTKNQKIIEEIVSSFTVRGAHG